jgi:hypothetical protein
MKNSLTWIIRPRVLGMLLAKLLLSVATPLAGQPNEVKVASHCAVYASAMPACKHASEMARISLTRKLNERR